MCLDLNNLQVIFAFSPGELRTSNTIVTNCTATNNAAIGIAVGGGTNNTLTSNTANGNGGSNFGAGGISVFQSRNNTFIGNTVDGNIGAGIVVFQSTHSTGNLFQANKAHNNSTVDLSDENLNCVANTWKSNQYGTANPACID